MSDSHHENSVLFQASRFRVERRIQAAADGSMVERQIVVHPGAVVILPLLDGDQVCLIHNERVAVGKTLIELPAGTLDRDEPPIATAKRELAEETGYIAAQWQELPGFFMSPGILMERMHVYVASQLQPGLHAREPGENISNLLTTWGEAMRMVDHCEIEDAKTIATLLMWDRRRPK